MMPVLASMDDQTSVMNAPQVGSVVEAMDVVNAVIRRTLVTQTKIPSKKMTMTPSRFESDICSRAMMGIGSKQTQTSVSVL